jgi:hypothetical protein
MSKSDDSGCFVQLGVVFSVCVILMLIWSCQSRPPTTPAPQLQYYPTYEHTVASPPPTESAEPPAPIQSDVGTPVPSRVID